MRADTPIYIVDDDRGVRDSLAAGIDALGYLEVRTFASGEEFLNAAPPWPSGPVLLDLDLPGMTGWDVQQTLAGRPGAFPVVVLTGTGDVTQAVRAMRNGAIDFLEKPFDIAMLAAALDSAVSRLHEALHSRSLIERSQDKLARLSGREREVLTGLIEGHSNKTIARTIGLSPRTVEIYRAKLMDKLDAGSVSDVLRVVFAAGVIGPTPQV